MNPAELPSPGLHYGVAFEDYQRWPAINFSTLKPIRKTASKCKWEMDNKKKPTLSMVLGSSLHVATLEPARFDQLFFICPPCDRRNADGKAIYAKAELEAGGRPILRSGQDDASLGEVGRVRDMASAIHASRAVKAFLSGPGQNEVSALWRDEQTGLMCKGRFDRLLPKFNPWACPVIVEIKTTKDAGDWSFGRDCHSMGYAAQGASYCFAHKAITGVMPAHVFIAVENHPPHDLQVHMLDGASLQTGLLQYRQMLTRYAECVKSGKWPGYPDIVNTLSLPKYANEETYE